MKYHVCPTCGTEHQADPNLKRISKTKKCAPCRLDATRTATREFMRRQRLAKPDHVSLLKKTSRYGLSADQYADLLEVQRFRCAGCVEPIDARSAYVDHDHRCCSERRACGQCVRGLLCSRCNTTLGMARDNAGTLRRLANYLDRYGWDRAVAS